MTQELIVESTREAISRIQSERFFKTERGYQGRLYCELQESLEARNVLTVHTLLEIEYQKRDSLHNLTQRPDIILHTPAELSGHSVSDNNFAVWALKRNANPDKAIEDFAKLDEMFETLRYPIGLFINIDSDQHMLEYYDGSFHERIYSIAVTNRKDQLSMICAQFTPDHGFEIEIEEIHI